MATIQSATVASVSRTEGDAEATLTFDVLPKYGVHVGSKIKIQNKINGSFLPEATVVGLIDQNTAVVTGLSQAGVSDPFEIPDNEIGNSSTVLTEYPMGDVS